MIHMVFPAIIGEYNVNGACFSNCNLTLLRMEITENTFASMSLPNNITNIFYHTLSNLKYDKKDSVSSGIEKRSHDIIVGFTHVQL